MSLEIRVTLPADRTKPGTLELLETGALLGDRQLLVVACLGKADNRRALVEGNPSRDPLKPYGDTPTGIYGAVNVVTLDPPHKRLGAVAIALRGVAGDALQAAQLRTGLFIHGGPDEPKYDERLIPTLGCLRLLNRDMKRLAQLAQTTITAIHIETDPQEA